MAPVLPVEGGPIQVRRALQAISKKLNESTVVGGTASKAGRLLSLDTGGLVDISTLVPVAPMELLFFANAVQVAFDDTGEV